MGTVTRSAVIAVLRTVRDGQRPPCDTVPQIDAITAAIGMGWLETDDGEKHLRRWRLELTDEGRKQAGPVLRLIAGGRG
jgi:hypothetical protein